ncbi:MAG: TfuA protein [uncultured bacterium]|nr:MAG: TfuA protein [uncultured bacterium]
MNHTTLVFVGPTIPLLKAQKILPGATFLPPVKCGDLLQVARLKPRIIGIIDGTFEHTAAVWHKEILWCLEQGITIYGASSMGALRAAELDAYGMIGIGKIYQAFRDGILNDDDEVAVAHTPGPDYATLSDPMINIRATLTEASNQHIISDNTHDQLIKLSKNTFYQHRHLASLIMKLSPSDEMFALQQWLVNDNYIDLKQRDAISLFEHLREREHHQTQKNQTHQTVYLRTLNIDTLCKPLSFQEITLPSHEQTAKNATKLGEGNKLLVTLARLLSTAYCYAKENNLLQSNAETQENNYLNRMKWIKGLIHAAAINSQNFNEYLSNNILKLSMLYAHQHDNKISELMAIIWTALEYFIRNDTVDFQLSSLALEHFSTQFRRKNNLLTVKSMTDWMQKHHLQLFDYEQLIACYALFSFFVLQNNLILQMNHTHELDSPCWLIDALHLSDTYSIEKFFEFSINKNIFK